MNRSTWLSLMFALVSLAACGDRPVFGPGLDGGPRDATTDARTVDGGRDAALVDAGPDAAASDAAGFDSAVDGGRRGPLPVLLGDSTDLRAPGAYVLIGQTGITNVIGSMISGGHLGVSPADSTTITGFGLILDSSGQFSGSVSVVPPARVYAADYATPTPANLTAAILGMQTAYSDAAARSLPDFLNLSTGHLGGLVLAPGLYRFGSSVDIAADVTLSGGPDDVWIVTWLVFGLVVGVIARAVYPGAQTMGLFATAVLGIVGSFVGGALGNLIAGAGVLTFHAAGILGSVVGAVILLGASSLGRRSAT